MPRGLKRVPLQWMLVVPFMVQIFAAVGLTGWLAFRNGQLAIRELAHQLETEIATRIQQNLEVYLKLPHQINQANANAIRQGQLSLEDHQALEKYLWHQVQIFTDANFILVGTETGTYIGAELLENQQVELRISDASTNYHLRGYLTDEQGSRTQLRRQHGPYNPRQRPWYQVAVSRGKATWSDIYIRAINNSLLISPVLPIYNEQN